MNVFLHLVLEMLNEFGLLLVLIFLGSEPLVKSVEVPSAYWFFLNFQTEKSVGKFIPQMFGELTSLKDLSQWVLPQILQQSKKIDYITAVLSSAVCTFFF